jgi:hypothetical protein
VVAQKEMVRGTAVVQQVAAGCVGEKFADFVSIKLTISIIKTSVS